MKDFDIDEFKNNIYNHYSIAASAGTGKTYSMIQILKAYKERNISLDKVLIVTYTEKAAGELKDRIKDNIPEADVSQMHVGTIHSFCKDTIKEFFPLMKLPSNLTVVDDSKCKELMESLIRKEWYANRIDIEDINLKDLEVLINKFYLNSDYQIDDSIIGFEENLFTSFYLDFRKRMKSLRNKSEEEIKEFFKNWELLDIDPNIKKFYEKLNDGFLNVFSLKEELIAKQAKKFTLKTESNLKSIDKCLASIYKNIQEKGLFKYRSINDVKSCAPLFEEINKYNFDKVLLYKDFLINLYRQWQEEKKHNKWMTFNDMLREVREAVINNDKLVLALRDKYQFALIDEFQDTNQIQWDIFKTVFLKSEKNKIVVVGDPKQSIYSFQGADINVYNNATKEIIKQGGVLYNLPNNYRSTKTMVNGYNALFKTEAFNSLKYEDVGVGNIYQYQTYKDQEINGLRIITNGFKDSDGKMNYCAISPSDYAKYIVKTICDFCDVESDGNTCFRLRHRLENEPTNDPNEEKNRKPRNISFKDIMILARNRSEFDYVEYELKRAGIPYVKYKDNNLFTSVECYHWIALINALLKDDFTGKNRNAFRKALYTKFFGRSLEEINSPYFDRDDIYEMEMIIKWRTLCLEGKYDELIDSILTKSMLEKILSGLTDIQSLNIFRQIGDYALSFLLEENSLYDLKIDLMKKAKGLSDDEEGDSIVAKGTDFDCVELMTMHASKGLDGKIVFVVGGYRKDSSKNSSVGIYHENNKALLTCQKDRYSEEAMEEKERLFYVAYTRARNLLVIPNYEKNNDVRVVSSIPKLLQLSLDNPSICDVEIYDDKYDLDNIRATVKRILAPKNKDQSNEEDLYKKISSVSSKIHLHKVYKHSYASMSKSTENSFFLDDKLNANKEGEEINQGLKDFDLSSFTKKLLYYPELNPILIPEKFPKGAVIGTTLHEIFEIFNFEEINKPINRLDEIIEERFNANSIHPEPSFLNYVHEMVYNVLNAHLPIIHGGNIFENQYFKLSTITKENRKAEAEFIFSNLEEENLSDYYNGFIDLLFRNGDYYSILDWKSDTINDNDLLSYSNLEDLKKRVDEHYSIQRVLYSYCLVKWLFDLGIEDSLEEVFDKHFGGVYYVFIRGCNPDTSNGIYAQTWKSYSDLENEYLNIIRKCRG